MSVSIEGFGSARPSSAEVLTPEGLVITFDNFVASKRMAEAIRGVMESSSPDKSINEIFDDAA